MKMLTYLVAVTVAICGLVVTERSALAIAANITGTWEVTIHYPPPDGDYQATYVLKQEGEKVRAMFNPGHDGDIPMSGTFVKGALALTSPANDEGQAILMKGTLKADGSMSGFMSSMMGDMTWSATRDRSK